MLMKTVSLFRCVRCGKEVGDPCCWTKLSENDASVANTAWDVMIPSCADKLACQGVAPLSFSPRPDVRCDFGQPLSQSRAFIAVVVRTGPKHGKRRQQELSTESCLDMKGISSPGYLVSDVVPGE